MAEEKDDLHLQRASSAMIAKTLRELPKLVRKPSSTRLNFILNQIEPFQGDPQLLDVHLKHILPPVVEAYIKQVEKPGVSEGHTTEISTALSTVLYTFCKVRGESPVVGFFANEPRFLEPFVLYFEKHDNESLSWKERYILLLWLSHLTLTPFDLNSMSTELAESPSPLRLSLPSNTPPLAARILRIALQHLSASSREMKAAARLMARLCIRADMRSIDLPESLVNWALPMSKSDSSTETSSQHLTADIQLRMGVLVFLEYLVVTAAKDICGFVPQIYAACQKEMDDCLENPSAIKPSTTTKRTLIKLLRNVVVVCVSHEPDIHTDVSAIVEEVIGQLLESLGDKETPLRMTASKALSMITLRLPHEMVEEIVQSILDSFNINVLRSAGFAQVDRSQVDPAQWHGMTLTLGQLLFRRAPPTFQLPAIFKTLLLALNFEQRSPTGVSMGANVRDAANFGIWSLSRRYGHKELALVDVNEIEKTSGNGKTVHGSAHGSRGPISTQQLLATELLASACLDPNGNIRRGSSAALQELVGRHPDTIFEGISLVQVVDYHAVGLRKRAMVEVSSEAAALGKPAIYLLPLFHRLLGWRGVGSGDVASRSFAAEAIGRLSGLYDKGLFEVVVDRLQKVEDRDVEQRHGLLLCLAALVDTKCRSFLRLTFDPNSYQNAKKHHADLLSLTLKTWALFGSSSVLRLSDRDFVSHPLRPELTTAAVATLITSLARASATLSSKTEQMPGFDQALQLVPLCLDRFDDTVLSIAPFMARNLILMLNEDERSEIAQSWLSETRKGNARVAIRQSGRVLALGAAFPHLDEHDGMRKNIIETLCRRCSGDVEVEARVIALKGLRWVLDGTGQESQGSWRTTEPTPYLPAGELGRKTIEAILTGLNDYTINERGDVGSLVRIQALEVSEALPRDIKSIASYEELFESIFAASRRLSVEKLDKLRLKASQIFTAVSRQSPTPPSLQSVSSYDYFRRVLRDSFFNSSEKVAAAVFEGLSSSAGGGASENIVQNARAALVQALDEGSGSEKSLNENKLLSLCNIFLDVLRQSLDNERTLTPLLDTFGFLFDAGVFQRLLGTDFRWRTLLSLAQKSHYKSSSIPKILAAMSCYRGLAEIDVTRVDVLKKLQNMLKHPFPKIRDAAVEALFLVTNDDGLRSFTTSS